MGGLPFLLFLYQALTALFYGYEGFANWAARLIFIAGILLQLGRDLLGCGI